MSKVLKIAVLCAAAALAVAAAVAVRSSVNDIDESYENDIPIIIADKNTKLPEGLMVFSEEDGSAPALWRVTASDGSCIYMMGSVHALTRSVYPLNGNIKAAFDSSDAVAVEIKNVDASDMIVKDAPDRYPVLLDNDDELKDHLSPDVYDALAEYLAANGSDIEEVKHYRPWYILRSIGELTTVDAGEASAGYGADRVLQISANISDKPIYSIETLEEKMAYYPEMPEDILEFTLMRSLTGDVQQQMAEIVEKWRTGDIEACYDLTYGTDGLTEDERALMERSVKYCITDRNHIMAERAEGYLADGGKVFFIAGTAHFVGEEGIPALLEKDGYTVERIQ